jgi:cytochrome P450
MTTELARFDFANEAMLSDPYPTYRALRNAGPVCRGGPAQWVVTRYAEVAALLRDRRLGREFPPEYQALSVGNGPANDFLRRIIIDRDPDEHTRLRRLFTKAMSPALIRSLSVPIGLLVEQVLEQADDEGGFDAVTQLAVPVPIIMMSELFGIPAADRVMLADWSVALSKAFAVFIPPQERAVAHQAVQHLRDYVHSLLLERRRHPGDDLLSRMLAAGRQEDRLSDEEIVDNAVFIYYAGFETTTNLVATGCMALVSHQDEQTRLRADRSLLPTAMEEFLRYDAPIHTTTRLALEPIEIGDRTIRPGRVVVLVLASANHDERQFDRPDQLDVGRQPNAHLSFGGGVHHCLGAVLARVESSAVFDRLLDLYTRIEPAGEAVWRPSGGGFRFPYCAYESIPVGVTRSAGRTAVATVT